MPLSKGRMGEVGDGEERFEKGEDKEGREDVQVGVRFNGGER